jgi:hypothetical protein
VDKDPYRLAAVGYAAYGLVYLLGAVLELTPERMRSFGGVPWWVFYVVGAALLGLMPILVWKHFTWLTRLLALGPAGKALSLSWLQSRHAVLGEPTRPYDWFFIVVAIVAATLLARAGFSRASPRAAAAGAAGARNETGADSGGR